ncbi:MAG: FAD-dependent oxidoreductase [Alphaproteobacteria bacterium]
MENKKIIIIGGSAAGPKAAAKARRIDENAEITIIQKGAELSMASCGYPYYVGGCFDNRNMLLCTPTGVVRDPNFYMNVKKINAKTETEVLSINRKAKTVLCQNLKTGEKEELSYDKLIITTGATANRPPIEGIDLDGITTLQSMQDADYLRKIRDEKKIKKAVVIGGGLIGIETCEALRLAGIEVSIIEMQSQVLTFLDWDMAKIVENYIRSKDVNIYLENGLKSFIGKDGRLTGIKLSNGTEIECQLAVLAIGVKPNSKLAKEAGIEIGKTGGIIVDKHMKTSDPDIYAAGDCVEIENIITGNKVHAPYGDLANLEGRVAGENAIIGDKASFPGTIQTGICKIFEYAAGSTGLSEKAAKQNGFDDIETVVNASPDKPGFMNGKLLISKLVVNRKDNKILGAQCVGIGDVSKQIAIWATAIKGKLTLEDMINNDLPYAPPFSLALDHSIATAHIMENKLKDRLKGLSAVTVKAKLEANQKPYLLDVRGPDEYEAMRLGVGETLIPLGALRKRLNELPQDRNQEIICYCKISLRGYEAALILEASGFKNVKVLEGGIMAWPYPREK